MESRTDYFQLLLKKWRGELTDAESNALARWERESPDATETARVLEFIWEESAAYVPEMPEVDADAAFAAVRQKAGIGPRRRRLLSPGQWLRVAAVFIGLVSAIWLFNAREDAWETRYAENGVLENALPDQSRVWLRSGATLTHPQQFEEQERRVRLKGEAFFDVTRHENQPFVVEIEGGSVVEVLGTSFGISAAEGEERVTVWVKSGKVRFRPNPGQQAIIMSAGERAVYQVREGKLINDQPGIANDFAWHNGGLAFDNMPLKNVVAEIERHYGVSIRLINPALGDCRYTASLVQQQPVEAELDALAFAMKCRVIRRDDTHFELSGGSCR
ncbi:MAG: FecR domain-containing protein [Saprospiraceae bacterium]|nr:FecR domain-containing protein [Saprospiraceae bacterium]